MEAHSQQKVNTQIYANYDDWWITWKGITNAIGNGDAFPSMIIMITFLCKGYTEKTQWRKVKQKIQWRKVQPFLAKRAGIQTDCCCQERSSCTITWLVHPDDYDNDDAGDCDDVDDVEDDIGKHLGDANDNDDNDVDDIGKHLRGLGGAPPPPLTWRFQLNNSLSLKTRELALNRHLSRWGSKRRTFFLSLWIMPF